MFKKLIKLLSRKSCATIISLLLDVAMVVLSVLTASYYASYYFIWVWVGLGVIAVIVCIYIVSSDVNPGYKLSWCIMILGIPCFGLLIYLTIGRQHMSRRARKKLKKASDASQIFLNATNAVITKSGRELNPTGSTCADLVLGSASYPVYANTKTKFYPLGDDFFPDLIQEIKQAKKYIFMEYFIIEPGVIWNEIENALIERAANGVEVKIIYDDFGCITTLPRAELVKLKANGITAKPFNTITPTFDMRLNNRSHRKITVIDGKIAYCGGNNLADEYANKKVLHGHWKDSHMRFEGEAVWGFTSMFLSFWRILSDESIEVAKYIEHDLRRDAAGYVQPLSAGPRMRDENIIENAFINLISTAKKYVYITTPYLILDNEIQTALVNAAKSGIDVRIIIPKIPDKKMVYKVTKSFVPVLKKAGVRVYCYSPGFIHAKEVIVDDERAFIGTCNMDYRSFYLHYECGALLYGVDSISDMKRDFLSTLDVCSEISYDDAMDVTIFTKIGQSILRLFAPAL